MYSIVSIVFRHEEWKALQTSGGQGKKVDPEWTTTMIVNCLPSIFRSKASISRTVRNDRREKTTKMSPCIIRDFEEI